MNKGVVIADAGPIISLAVIEHLDLLDQMFEKVRIPVAIWEEITADDSKPKIDEIKTFFKNRVVPIKTSNELIFVMDYGESEALTLYHEISANYLLIDDRKARKIAEALGAVCIGTIGLLGVAKKIGLILELKPLFEKLLINKRYYSVELLNTILVEIGEKTI